MNLIDLETAVSHIHQSCADEEIKPFFFVVGAGISLPSIPLASQIVDACKNVAAKWKRDDEPELQNASDSYSHWFQLAYPQRVQRQKYLRNLIEDKAISAANLRLAHLLLDKQITNLVVTPNFDDLLARSLNLFGASYVICDHPQTAERIDPERNDLQIVHVHGTYQFYDCCNLAGEIQERSKNPSADSYTMRALLDNILLRRSPLVIGYSGWEGDVIMAALKRRLSRGALPNNLYWFCYRREHIAAFPNWLTDHPNVCFVGPVEKSHEHVQTEETNEPRPTALTSRTPKKAIEESNKNLVSGTSVEITLSAQEILDSLVRSFGLEAPLLTRDPLKFFAQYLRKSLPQVRDQDDLYAIGSVIDRVGRAAEHEREIIEGQAQIETLLEPFRDALRRSKYREAVQIIYKLDTKVLNDRQRCDLISSLWDAALALNDSPDDVIDACEQILLLGEILTQPIPKSSVHTIANALFKKAYILQKMERWEEAIIAWDQLIIKYSEFPAITLQEKVATALLKKGWIFHELKHHEEAIKMYKQIVEKYSDSPETVLHVRVANALLFEAQSLYELERYDEILPALEQSIGKYSDSPETDIQEQVALAMRCKGYLLIELERQAEAITAFDEAIKKFIEFSATELKEQVAGALVEKGSTLFELEFFEEGIAAYDQVIEKYSDSAESALQEQVAKALIFKGASLEALEEQEEATAIYNQVIERFSNSPEPALKEQVRQARLNTEKISEL
ncbi:hypothetical protein C1752_00136 [Acaryochloris thomasi RCC1774]|uniref:Uncharacterized protein n=1 Tax=Acaryochloris thomasi RCC1774 TaxID=1764569 RepID=A0A2W1JP37_9CYAN|nr:tetratricopeptide repeat protein [Acaryochloris thomasi]PZD75006.1 hypothetical protein C1752_00136 [Acaryochloris thomasi RCC1774]